MVPNNCHFCGKTSFEHTPTKFRYPTDKSVYECLSCGLVFLHPLMTPEEERAFYEKEYAETYSREKGTTIEELHNKRKPDAEMYYEWVKRNAFPYTDCLEVGCASGYFLEYLRNEKGFENVAGVEIHPVLRRMCKKLDIQTFSSIEDCESGSFSFLFAFFLLEHLSDPVRFLCETKRVCRPGGKIFVVVPNVKDALLSSYEIPAFRDFYFTPAHQFYFSPTTLRDAFRKAGLRNVGIYPEQRYDISNHIHWMMIGEPGGAGKYADITGYYTNEVYQETLKNKWLCDTLLAVAEMP